MKQSRGGGRGAGSAHHGAGPVGGALEEGERVREPTPQFKGKAGSSPGQKIKETSGLWQQRCGLSGWVVGRGEESPAQSKVARQPCQPRLSPSEGSTRRLPRGPCPPGSGQGGRGAGCSTGRPCRSPGLQSQHFGLWTARPLAATHPLQSFPFFMLRMETPTAFTGKGGGRSHGTKGQSLGSALKR